MRLSVNFQKLIELLILKDIEGCDILTAQTNLAPVDQLGKDNYDPSQTSQTPLTTQPNKQ